MSHKLKLTLRLIATMLAITISMLAQAQTFGGGGGGGTIGGSDGSYGFWQISSSYTWSGSGTYPHVLPDGSIFQVQHDFSHPDPSPYPPGGLIERNRSGYFGTVASHINLKAHVTV